MCKISSLLYQERLVKSWTCIRRVPLGLSLRSELGIRYLLETLDWGHWVPLVRPTLCFLGRDSMAL